MPFKPIAYNASLGGVNNFAEQRVQVSISVDEFHFHDRSSFRMFIQIEPKEVIDLEQRIIDSHEFYDVILAWNDRVLAECPNAVKFIFGTTGLEDPGRQPDVENKQFAASFLTSNKSWCPGHKLRQDLYEWLPKVLGQLEIDKYKSPPFIEPKSLLLEKYQYAIVAENTKRTNWLASATIDAFLMKTIPLYWGCPNIGDYFNIDGILSFDTYPELVAHIESLTPEFYATKTAAIEDNFLEAQKYLGLTPRVDAILTERLNEHPRVFGNKRTR